MRLQLAKVQIIELEMAASSCNVIYNNAYEDKKMD